MAGRGRVVRRSSRGRGMSYWQPRARLQVPWPQPGPGRRRSNGSARARRRLRSHAPVERRVQARHADHDRFRRRRRSPPWRQADRGEKTTDGGESFLLVGGGAGRQLAGSGWAGGHGGHEDGYIRVCAGKLKEGKEIFGTGGLTGVVRQNCTGRISGRRRDQRSGRGRWGRGVAGLRVGLVGSVEGRPFGDLRLRGSARGRLAAEIGWGAIRLEAQWAQVGNLEIRPRYSVVVWAAGRTRR